MLVTRLPAASALNLRLSARTWTCNVQTWVNRGDPRNSRKSLCKARDSSLRNPSFLPRHAPRESEEKSTFHFHTCNASLGHEAGCDVRGPGSPRHCRQVALVPADGKGALRRTEGPAQPRASPAPPLAIARLPQLLAGGAGGRVAGSCLAPRWRLCRPFLPAPQAPSASTHPVWPRPASLLLGSSARMPLPRALELCVRSPWPASPSGPAHSPLLRMPQKTGDPASAVTVSP